MGEVSMPATRAAARAVALRLSHVKVNVDRVDVAALDAPLASPAVAPAALPAAA
jgi:hypothetical protein